MNTGSEATWLKLLPLELSQIEEKDFIEPPDELEPNDKTPDERINQAGEMSIDERRLYTLWKTVEKSSFQLMLDSRYSKPNDEVSEKIHEIKSKAETLGDLFWITIRDGHRIWRPCSIGVRRGYKVVWYMPKDDGPRLFGPFRLE